MERLTVSPTRRGFLFAHGGKDRHPFPVPLRVYDQTIRVLKSAVQKARLGREEELDALKRLDDQARRLERYASGPSFETAVAEEKQRSPGYGGRSIFGWEHDRSVSRPRASKSLDGEEAANRGPQNASTSS